MDSIRSGRAKHDKSYIMNRILEIRYTDIEEEKSLCEELLQISTDHDDNYGKAYAYTYLGDYYIAVNDIPNMEQNLMLAKKLLEKEEPYTPLTMRFYGLLGLYYDIQSNEQASIQYYLMAKETANRLGDIRSECTVLNNIAYAYQRHHSYTEAFNYYEKAYQLQKCLVDFPLLISLLSNLMDVCLMLGRPDDAMYYLEQCEQVRDEVEIKCVNVFRNKCYYYAMTGDASKAAYWADRFLEISITHESNLMEAFEHYALLFRGMYLLNNQVYAERFLKLMEMACDRGGLWQHQVLEDERMEYALRFEAPEKHAKAYKEYFLKTQEFRKKINENIVNAMKGNIRLEQVTLQREQLESEQQYLQDQANLDELTGIFNRRYLEQGLKELSEEETGIYKGVIMLDIDYFKEYNDSYGHRNGDDVLQIIGKCLRENTREGIEACRYGGDEFTCLCRNVSDNEIEDYILAVRRGLEKSHISHDYSRCAAMVTLSIGYSNEAVTANMDAHDLMQLADQALYEAKISGRNTYRKKSRS